MTCGPASQSCLHMLWDASSKFEVLSQCEKGGLSPFKVGLFPWKWGGGGGVCRNIYLVICYPVCGRIWCSQVYLGCRLCQVTLNPNPSTPLPCSFPQSRSTVIGVHLPFFVSMCTVLEGISVKIKAHIFFFVELCSNCNCTLWDLFLWQM